MEAKIFAERLRMASESKNAIPPLRHDIGTDQIDLAYEIQNINTRHRINQGARVIGKKIGLTSIAVQNQLGVDQPDFGILFHDMEIPNGLSISVKELMQPKIEAEIAFVLSKDLDKENISSVDVINAIDYALPALEIVGSRIENWDIKFTDTVADNASASHFVLGSRPMSIQDFDMVNCKMEMFKNDELVSSGTGAACLGSPLNAAVWLANKMFVLGHPLKKGELILSGAVGPMVNISAGDLIRTSIEGLGDVSVSFTQ